jgi:aldehyde dehydrogenase (NAD+)
MSTIDQLFNDHQAIKAKVKNSTATYRVNKLIKLKEAILAHTSEIHESLIADFGKPSLETDLTEILPIISGLNFLIKELPKFMKGEKVKTPLLFTGAKSYIRHEAKGNVLVISPWNYPFQLSFYPVMTSFAAGNTTILKPSEFTPATNAIVEKILTDIFSKSEVAVVHGGVEVSTALLELPFDHIFFTGSTEVGKLVMQSAAKNLASVGLELGGKSPVIIDKNFKLDKAAKKIAWAKCVNAGQTCVAPDYVFVPKGLTTQFAEYFSKSVEEFYHTKNNPHDFAKIISQKHTKRLQLLIEDAVSKGAKIHGELAIDLENRTFQPVIITNVNQEMKVMQEEIFGPILPLVEYTNTDELISSINAGDNPLSLYIFSNDEFFQESIMSQTQSGGVTINDLLINVAHAHLPFGGAGKSGIGYYHGRWGLEEFSHLRSVMSRGFDMGADYFYPPYTSKKQSMVKKLFEKISGIF